MKLFLQILFFFAWFTNLNATPTFAKVVLSSHEFSFSKTEIVKEECAVKVSVQIFARNGIDASTTTQKAILRENYVLEESRVRMSGEVVQGAGKIFNSIDEAVLSKIDDITERVYRGDARIPNEIFENGFTCKGTNTDIRGYVEMNTPSNFIGTSKSPQQALIKSYSSQSEGYVYVIGKNGQMTDVNNWYTSIEGYPNPYFSELEVVFENTIPKTNIQGAFRINSQGEVIGDLIPNPNYIP